MKPICRCNTTNPLQDDLAQCCQLFFHEIIYKTILTAVRNARTTDTQRESFFRKSQIFWLGLINWAEKFWGIWGIFGQFISTHLGTVDSLSMFSILIKINHYFYKKQFYIQIPKIHLGVGVEFGPERNRYLVIVGP
jgi:hypothetical protein